MDYIIKYFKYKNKYLNEKNKHLKIMSYNLCWEALSGLSSNPNKIKHTNGLNMKHCNILLDNKTFDICLMNIIHIINSKLNEDYDFLCFQEINLTDFNKMKNKLNLLNYNYLLTPSKNENVDILTIYNNKKYNLISNYPEMKESINITNINSNLNDVDDKSARPFQILLFQNNYDDKYILLINIHMPHIYDNNYDKNFTYDHIYSFNKIKNEIKNLLLNKNYKIDNYIICGDFNHNDPFKFFKFNEILKIDFIKNKIINTCCYLNTNKTFNYNEYDKSFDNIFISNKNYNNIKYMTLNETELLNFSEINHLISDHLPIFSEYYYE